MSLRVSVSFFVSPKSSPPPPLFSSFFKKKKIRDSLCSHDDEFDDYSNSTNTRERESESRERD